ncbi:hypothetical protein AGLY_007990 [Aphis glycines]|uniref:Uncharacterized protein n=1 Tax=Aphis glycines TaxID=307491 RepID=A0A6G0TLW0_APHGL|nr:hypothetical protein AGLY_007990 [Aphis glycines]
MMSKTNVVSLIHLLEIYHWIHRYQKTQHLKLKYENIVEHMEEGLSKSRIMKKADVLNFLFLLRKKCISIEGSTNQNYKFLGVLPIRLLHKKIALMFILSGAMNIWILQCCISFSGSKVNLVGALEAFEVQILTKIRHNHEYLQIVFSGGFSKYDGTVQCTYYMLLTKTTLYVVTSVNNQRVPVTRLVPKFLNGCEL